MTRILALAVMCTFVVGELAGVKAQQQETQKPSIVTGAVVQVNGVISGNVKSSSGRPLSGITMQLVDARGTPVGKPVTTSRDGDFTFAPIAYDTYTLQCIQQNKVIGTSNVILKAPTESVSMTCTSDVVAWWKHPGVVTGLVAAAAAVGTAAVVAATGDASGSR